ncbi:hypothetical protein BDU57DRAFT_459387 [Ampelomyces quisqualis]|uniref:Lipocalin-like domain-containing protein n=1 Tax=Ampelomyces quisqualis TaxID=50730 RepID=A0A6A5QA30_AMPQU|nr:hypothetical protein BDU57DRAFT_459387 [Ampelomyces quisqualis]
MAAPSKVDIKNLQGKWVMNKTLSDSPDAVLALQGVGWLTRKTIGLATVTQHLKQFPTTGADGKPTIQIDIEQTATGGMKGTSEYRTLDWEFRGHTDWLFGTLQGRTRYNTIKAILEENKGKGTDEEDAKYLVEGWLKETEEGEVVESFVDNDGAKWTGWQIWGFAEINGERKLTRRFAIRKKNTKEVIRIRLTYDWAGDLE